jgi:AcrR family transcriptional regulator
MPKRDPGYMQRQREQILDNALRCFAVKGFHSTSLDDIARRCRLSTGGIYVHFSSKLAVYDALTERSFKEFDASPAAHFGTFEQLVEVAIANVSNAGSRYNSHFALRLLADVPGDRDLRKRIFAMFERQIEYCVRIARRDPMTRDLPERVQREIARRVILAIGGVQSYKLTLPDLDSQMLRRDLQSMIEGIVRVAALGDEPRATPAQPRARNAAARRPGGGGADAQ